MIFFIAKPYLLVETKSKVVVRLSLAWQLILAGHLPDQMIQKK